MGKITLYHGTPDKLVIPKYGDGDEKHDLDLDLAVKKVGKV